VPIDVPDIGKPGNVPKPLFQEPPDDLGEGDWPPGALLVSLGSYSGYERIEVARAFRTAAERLLDSAVSARESWEAVYPILFCYRHTTELYLKAILEDAPLRHGLADLASALREKITGRYRPDHVDQLICRIHELHRIDPSSTVFRYADAAEKAYKIHKVANPDPELWVDFQHLRRTMGGVFTALDMIWLRSLEEGRF
jgi:hypothetical protein